MRHAREVWPKLRNKAKADAVGTVAQKHKKRALACHLKRQRSEGQTAVWLPEIMISGES